MGFFRFPRTPHLAWLGAGTPRADKVLDPSEAEALLRHELVVEEKVDGANVGLSLDEQGGIRAQNRGTYLAKGRSHPQFEPLFRWISARRARLLEALSPDWILFGEWCWAVHAVEYTRLPDWFLLFDVYERGAGVFWDAARRDALAARLELEVVPRLAKGRFDLKGLRGLLGPSRLTEGPAEGLYLRAEAGGVLTARAKLVRPEFVQQIDVHWSKQKLRTNALATRVSPSRGT